MSPSEALQSPVFLGYLAAAVGLLAGAGIVLAVLRWGLRRDVDHACRSYLGWLLMVPPVLGAIFLGREAAIVVFTIIGLMGFKEFARATGLYEDWWMTGVIYLGILAVGVLSLVTDPFTPVPGWYGMFIALPVYVIAAILVIPILRNRAQGQLQVIAVAMLGFVYFGWMFGHLAFLCNARFAYAYVLYLLFAVEINDVAAYTFGKVFGKHLLRSNISPKKTWEGSLGGAGSIAAVAVASARHLSAFWNTRVGAYWPHRRHRRTARRPGDQRHQARSRDQGHGRRHPRTRRRPRPHRQLDLRRTVVLPRGSVLSRYLLIVRSPWSVVRSTSQRRSLSRAEKGTR